MKKYLRLLLLLPLLWAPYGLFADVILTDEQATELNQTLDELEIISLKQKQRIADLQTRNAELETQLNQLEQQAEERQNLLNQQEKTLKEAKSSYRRRNLFSLVHDILISLGFGTVGFFIGLLLL